MTDQTWNPLPRDQRTWHWTQQLRDRLNGLTDHEYFWEPGAMIIDFATPDPRADHPPAALVLHINRELIHHLAEVRVLRDLHLHTHQPTRQEAS